MASPRSDEGYSPEAEFMSRLGGLEPDVSGVATLDMSPFDLARHREFRRIAEAHGWVLVDIDARQRSVHWRFAHRDSTRIPGGDPSLVDGPSLSRLSRHGSARDEAARAERELGVNPLSSRQLNEARRAHVAWWRRVKLWSGLATVCGLALIPVVGAGWPVIEDGRRGAAALVIAAVVLAVGAVIGVVQRRRVLRAGCASADRYKAAYERVAQAVLRGDSGDGTSSGRGG